MIWQRSLGSMHPRVKAHDNVKRSATIKHAYAYTLTRKAVVATMDLSAKNLKLLETDHWLADKRNVLQLHLSEPAWQTQQAAAAAIPKKTPLQTMRQWGAADVARFLEDADLAGPAGTLFTSGVNGVDLEIMTDTKLMSELRLTSFAANKVVRARDIFLQKA